MMSTGKLHIRLAKYIEGQTISSGAGVVANVYPTGKGAVTKGRRGITIPVSYDESIYQTVELDAGPYLVESVLPSGEIVSDEVTLESGESQSVVLRGESSPHEWLSWQQLSGNIQRQSFAPDEPQYQKAISPGADPFAYGLAEIGQGSFREAAFRGGDQWQTLAEMMGPESAVRMDEMIQRTRAAREGWPEAEGFEWVPGGINDFVTQVVHLAPDSGAGKGKIRDFLYWSAGGAELIRLPNIWISIDDFEPKAIQVMTNLSQEGRKFRTSVTVLDPSFATVLAYLTAGSLPQARLLFDRALEMLYEKRENPYAAAAGGYLLAGAGEPAPGDRWPGWIQNLRNRFPWLPDGAVLQAWIRLHAGDSDGAIGELKEAFRRGVPLYSAGIKRLLDGLSLVAAEDDECRQLERRVRQIAWRTNMDQAFTIIRLGPA